MSTTELGKMAQYSEEFGKRGAKLLGLSCDDLNSHNERMKDIEAYTVSFQYFKLTAPAIDINYN